MAENDQQTATTSSNCKETSPFKSSPIKRIDFAALGRKKSSSIVPRFSNLNLSQEQDPVSNEHLEGSDARNTKEVQQRIDGLAVQMDAQRLQLISPPPEETLSLRRNSGLRISSQSISMETPTTTTPLARTVSKRKRGPATPAKAMASAAFPGNDEEDTRVELPDITPNPKPRKQRHVHTPSLGSPTRESLGPPPSRGTSTERMSTDRELEKQLPTTPIRVKNKVVFKSPHGMNPEADYILPTIFPMESGGLVGRNSNAVVRRALLGAKGSRRSATPIPPYEPPSDVFTPPREVFLSPGPSKNISKSLKRKGVNNRRGPRANTTNLLPAQVKQEVPDDIDLRAPMPPPSPTDDPLLLSGPPEPEPGTNMVDEAPLQEIDTAYDEQDQSVGADSMEMDDPYDADVMPVRLFDWDVGAADDGGWTDSDDDGIDEGEGEYTGKWKMIKVPTKQDPPSSATRTRQELWGRPISPYPKTNSLELVSEEEEEEEEAEAEEEAEEEEVQRLSLEPEHCNSEDEDEKEERQVREMSMDFEEETELLNPDSRDAVSDDPRFIQEAISIGEEDETSDTDDEPGLVKITSTDPRAAARAAAILKQHDYDCYTKLIKKRRASHSATDDLAKEFRRRDTFTAGVSKIKRRRRSTMGVIGDKVIIPGTPVTTLPELLQDVEKEVAREATLSAWSVRTFFGTQNRQDPLKTPIPERSKDKTTSLVPNTPYPVGKRGWTKDDWKLLDACFTDQRLQLGNVEEGLLASVDIVALDDVITRFVSLMGGQSLIDTFGDLWTSENLLERARTLIKKQRHGNVAAPTSPFWSPTSTVTSVAAPRPPPIPTDFTRDHPELPARRTLTLKLPLPPTIENAPFENLSPAKDHTKRLAPTLLAPQYSHLLHEVKTVDDMNLSTIRQRVDDPWARMADISNGPLTNDESVNGIDTDMESKLTEDPVSLQRDPILKTESAINLSGRVREFFSSYLPVLSERQRPQTIRKNVTPGLPLPPLAVLQKQRGPVSTPLRPLLPRAPHPKELVHLNPAPPPSHIPRPKAVPKRLVELVPIPGHKTALKTQLVPRPRRSSGSSVKDLVKGFEQMEDMGKGNTVGPGFIKGNSTIMRKERKQAQSLKPKWRG